jgi:tetracycline repressor-like protein
MIGTLRSAGLAARDATWAVDTLTYFVVGHTIEEQLAHSLSENGKAEADLLRKALAPGRHPNLTAALDHLAAPHSVDHFDYGLDLILAGIHRRADKAAYSSE